MEQLLKRHIELRKKADRLTSGIPMSDVVYSDLVFLGKNIKYPSNFDAYAALCPIFSGHLSSLFC